MRKIERLRVFYLNCMRKIEIERQTESYLQRIKSYFVHGKKRRGWCYKRKKERKMWTQSTREHASEKGGGCRYSSVDSSAPFILTPWVRVPNTTSSFSSIN